MRGWVFWVFASPADRKLTVAMVQNQLFQLHDHSTGCLPVFADSTLKMPLPL